MTKEASARSVRMADYNYILPDEKIARFPLEDRESSKLLVYNQGVLSEEVFSYLPKLLPEGSKLVFNNTKVLQARLYFRTSTGASIEILCLSPLTPADYASALGATDSTEWYCMAGNLKKWREPVLELTDPSTGIALFAEKSGEMAKEGLPVKFRWRGDICFSEVLEKVGQMPIPPYLKREEREEDKKQYQTVYSSIDGSVAAPTAGLHFTPALLDRLSECGFPKIELTLHVGAGTFKPVKSEEIGDHNMHEEHFLITLDAIRSLKGGSIVAVGTTSARTLESLYIMGIRAIKGELDGKGPFYIGQWDGYNIAEGISSDDALSALEHFMIDNGIRELHVSTAIIIVPGYRFNIINGLITNYHQPGSTLLLLIAAFLGDDWRRVYDHALSNDFRFLSYGDSSLLIPV